MSSVDFNSSNPRDDLHGQPAWEVALLYPPQGSWSEQDYWALEGGRLIDFEDGQVEIHELPTKEHQRIVLFLYRFFFDYIRDHYEGEVLTAPLPVHLWQGKFREPDLVIVSKDRPEYCGYPDGADLVVEVVSGDRSSRRRDLEIKPNEYARSLVSEYWIVDPQEQRIRVGQLAGELYEWAVYERGQIASSSLMAGLVLSVTETLDSASPRKL